MTLDLVFVGANAGRTALAQLTAELGVSVRILAERVTVMEIFPVNILTIELAASDPQRDEAASWFARRGIHQLATAA
ncbi:NIL domain-containing protein [Propionibacteriaceae bacterium Y1923]|uniref:NIL domain-containing protein n=1 Tax=Aestuariimicrobium sp. Y1814 TaxID=3418742 RepID=UPI003C1359B0